ncbi:nuclear transport factor 2 family protein [uncultured Polaribacter sp.]|uniref:nuclear transport factor 2 family protein n=1 Tax=uncultured Polaribacter sp. TaxID=174711 RepID=UPI00262E4745|nr:nuclear transport factor 2 family protein [uncultured Polaribacter sp.]
MQKMLLVFVMSFFFYGCGAISKKTINKSSIKADVNTFMINWHKAASEANYKNYFKALDSSSIYIGTAAEETWTKKDFAKFSKPYFDKGKAWNFKTLDRNIFIANSGEFVWFNERLRTWMGTCRGSGVLEKINNNWVIKQYVLSVLIPNNDIQKVIKAKQKNDAIFLKQFKN